ncbi:MAG TPA: M28 family metallopeptidase [Myxococcota bacterium]
MLLAAGLCALAVAACGGGGSEAAPPAPTAAAALKVDRFDEDRAWRMLEYQVNLGPRPAGSPASRRLAAYIKARLPRGRYERVPGGLRNVVGEIPGRGKPIVLAAHYDTKDIEGFVGANDGAGGTAALLEIARVLRKTKRPAGAPPIRFVAFDGEEATDDSDFYGTGLRGSKAYARKHAKKIRELVLMDFIADKDLSIPREASSDERMWADLRRAARRVGAASAFPDETQGTVLDDHTPFVRAGVPAIDLIDFEFDCWHETCDDLSAVSKASLDKSGETVLEFLRTRR